MNSAANDEPLDAIPDEAFNRTNEEDDRGGEAVGGKSGEDAKGFSDVFRDREAVELELSERHEGFEGVGIIRKGVIVSRNCLHPDGGDEAEPFSGGGRRREFEPH